ncbi:MAG: TIGR01777 family protein [Acidimicrobiaceae bacterium]|nr:TIGR01777 family protein [Acidimicrobiaceae bacterium]
MKIVVAGSSGLIGSRLVERLSHLGHKVIRLRHGELMNSSTESATWNPSASMIDLSQVGQVDAIVNLAGEPIGTSRWTTSKRQRIVESRENGSRILVEAMGKMETPPKCFLNGSAIGYYGDTGDSVVDEDRESGEGFLAEVCIRNEAAAEKATALGVRVVHLRTGIVLAKNGGVLKKQLPLFAIGLGGRLGSGKQHLSWVHIDDEVSGIVFALETEITGPVNLTSPNPVTNSEFTKTLANIMVRPSFLSVPRIALDAVMGAEITQEMLLVSQKVAPKKLVLNGFRFQYPNLEGALRSIISG